MSGDVVVRRLRSAMGAELQPMTFPRYRAILQRLGRWPDVVAVGAYDDSPAITRPAGLALAQRHPSDGPGADLLSLYVPPTYRHRGVGQRLLGRLEAALSEDGCGEVSTVYTTRIPELGAFEGVLAARGWSEPVRRFLVFQSTRERLLQAEWMPMFLKLPPGYTVKPWRALSPAERLQLQAELAAPGSDIPADVSPLRYEGQGIDNSPPEPALSFACVSGTRVVGWHLAHRIGPESVRFSCSYVREDAQAHLPLLAMWVQAFYRLEATGYVQASWAVSPQRDAMLRFVHRFLRPYIDREDESRSAFKSLAGVPGLSDDTRGAD